MSDSDSEIEFLEVRRPSRPKKRPSAAAEVVVDLLDSDDDDDEVTYVKLTDAQIKQEEEGEGENCYERNNNDREDENTRPDATGSSLMYKRTLARKSTGQQHQPQRSRDPRVMIEIAGHKTSANNPIDLVDNDDESTEQQRRQTIRQMQSGPFAHCSTAENPILLYSSSEDDDERFSPGDGDDDGDDDDESSEGEIYKVWDEEADTDRKPAAVVPKNVVVKMEEDTVTTTQGDAPVTSTSVDHENSDDELAAFHEQLRQKEAVPNSADREKNKSSRSPSPVVPVARRSDADNEPMVETATVAVAATRRHSDAFVSHQVRTPAPSTQKQQQQQQGAGTRQESSEAATVPPRRHSHGSIQQSSSVERAAAIPPHRHDHDLSRQQQLRAQSAAIPTMQQQQHYAWQQYSQYIQRAAMSTLHRHQQQHVWQQFAPRQSTTVQQQHAWQHYLQQQQQQQKQNAPKQPPIDLRRSHGASDRSSSQTARKPLTQQQPLEQRPVAGSHQPTRAPRTSVPSQQPAMVRRAPATSQHTARSNDATTRTRPASSNSVPKAPPKLQKTGISSRLPPVSPVTKTTRVSPIADHQSTQPAPPPTSRKERNDSMIDIARGVGRASDGATAASRWEPTPAGTFGTGVFDEVDVDSDTEPDISADPELPVSMQMACSEHNTWRGFPHWRFSVHGGDDAILYDFRIFIDKSSIPGAGRGAYLTYMGARKLRKEKRVQSETLIKESKAIIPQTMVPLRAEQRNGVDAMVHLTGNNLHGNYNCAYWPLTSQPLEANVTKFKSFPKTSVTVNLVGEGISEHSELANAPADGVGFFGLNDPHLDYIPAPGTLFELASCIDLGVYAPLSASDRKEIDLYDIKSFIFGNVPQEWSFGVEENIRGVEQILDITDDFTGEPHKNAQNQIPMYVNEVGHNNDLQRTVYIGEKDNRTVHYFFQAPRKLRGGDTIELLTSYRSSYETMRERKGYGLKNIHRGDKTDDDRTAYLRREFHVRSHIVETIKSLPLRRLTDVIEFASKVWDRLIRDARDFLSILSEQPSHEFSPLSTLQWKALLRLAWLAKTFRTRVEFFRQKSSSLKGGKLFVGGFVETCDEMLQKINFCGISHAHLLLREGILDAQRQPVKKVIFDELVEEILFGIRDKVRLPFSGSLWCPLGCRLLDQLTLSLVKSRLRNQSKNDALKELATAFEAAAASATQSLNDCITRGSSKWEDLAFEAGTTCKILPNRSLENAAKELTHGVASAAFVGHGTSAKALHSAVLTVYESMQAGHGSADSGGFDLQQEKRFLVVKSPVKAHDVPNELQSLSSVVRPYSLARNQNATAKQPPKPQINASWYQVWQIHYVLMVFAKEFLPKERADTLLDKLQRSHSINPDFLRFALSRGMHTENSSISREARAQVKKDFKESIERSKRKPPGRKKKRKFESQSENGSNKRVKVKKAKEEKKSPTGTSNSGGWSGGKRPPAKLVYEGPPKIDLNYPGGWPQGWIQKTYQRQSGGSKGGFDSYFHSPQENFRLRSKIDVLRFLEKLKAVGGDESCLTKKKKFRAA